MKMIKKMDMKMKFKILNNTKIMNNNYKNMNKVMNKMNFIIKILQKVNNKEKLNKPSNQMNIKKIILKMIQELMMMIDFFFIILNFEDCNINNNNNIQLK